MLTDIDPLLLYAIAGGGIMLLFLLLMFLPSRPESLWVSIPKSVGLAFYGILFPVVYFFLATIMVPDSKHDCRFFILDCYQVGKLALTPLVFWACAAFAEIRINRTETQTPPWAIKGITIGAIVSTFCLVLGLIVHYIPEIDKDLFSQSPDAPWPVFLIYSGFFLPPLYVSVWYSTLAYKVVKNSGMSKKKIIKTILNTWPFWAGFFLFNILYYWHLPKYSSSCFVVTAAQNGHAGLVGPFEEVEHDSGVRLANRQLITFWKFEEVWKRHLPTSHRIFRFFYNLIGPVIASRIQSPLFADVVYCALKPLEWLALLITHRF